MEKLSHSAELVRVLYVLGWVRSYWFNRMVDCGSDKMNDKLFDAIELYANDCVALERLDIRDRSNLKSRAELKVALRAAKESDRKELEEKDRRIAELLSGCTRSHPHELMNPMCELRTDVARLTNHLATCQAEKEALEKKLAEQQAVIIHAAKCFPTTLGKYTERDTTELTKLLAAARQQGFEEAKTALGLFTHDQVYELQETARNEGKQAGRDELQKELSEQEPVAYIFMDNEEILWPNEVEQDVFKLAPENYTAFILRPLPPQVKG